jgi:Ulp1 family protease
MKGNPAMTGNNVLDSMLARLESLEATVKSQESTIAQLRAELRITPKSSFAPGTDPISKVQLEPQTEPSSRKLSRKRLLKGVAMAATVIGTTAVLNQNTAQAATVSNTDPNLAFEGTATDLGGIGVKGKLLLLLLALPSACMEKLLVAVVEE